MASTTVIQSHPILGKRRTRNDLVLRLSVSPELIQPPVYNKDKSGPATLVNGILLPPPRNRYNCTHNGCLKSYSKPSRLAEHQRSHTGERPFECGTCNKSYRRKTHLQAHARSHFPESSRPLVCSQEGCTKRFWTSQHLGVHLDWHNGSKPFQCSQPSCDEAFSKNYQLRAHVCAVHSPPGSKLYQCEHEGCTKTFNTNQHLRTHLRVHDERRYACVHSECLPGMGSPLMYFPNWTALQLHIRTAHQPKCPHPSCDGRLFSSQNGLSAHQKLHEQQELEKQINNAIISDYDNTNDDKHRHKRRRGGEIGRDWKCEMGGCDKDFKSKQALTIHMNVTHLGRRVYICSEESCLLTFGYKHLLQRHLARVHASATSPNSPSGEDEELDHSTGGPNIKRSKNKKPPPSLDIDTITGESYAQRARANIANGVALLCPYPQLDKLALGIFVTFTAEQGIQGDCQRSCGYAFSRAYDFRRHLKAAHDLDADKESVDQWVKEKKAVGLSQKDLIAYP